MNIFTAHKENYLELMKEVNTILLTLPGNPTDQRKALLKAKASIKEAEGILQTLKITLMNRDKFSNHEDLQHLLETYHTEISCLKKEIGDKEEEANRRALLSPRDDEIELKSTRTTVLMAKTTDRLKNITKTGADIIEMADGVSTSLDTQRQQMEGSRADLGGINFSLDKAKHLMNNIWTNMMTTQGIKIIIIIVLIIANLSIIYLRYIYDPNHGSNSTNPQPAPPPNNNN